MTAAGIAGSHPLSVCPWACRPDRHLHHRHHNIFVRGGGVGCRVGGFGWSMEVAPSHLPSPRRTCVPGPLATFGSGCFLCFVGPCDSLGTCTCCGVCRGRLPWGLCLPLSLSLFTTVPGAPCSPNSPLPPPLLTPHWPPVAETRAHEEKFKPHCCRRPTYSFRGGTNRSARAVSLGGGRARAPAGWCCLLVTPPARFPHPTVCLLLSQRGRTSRSRPTSAKWWDPRFPWDWERRGEQPSHPYFLTTRLSHTHTHAPCILSVCTSWRCDARGGAEAALVIPWTWCDGRVYGAS